jgi:deoxyhypusine synthase
LIVAKRARKPARPVAKRTAPPVAPAHHHPRSKKAGTHAVPHSSDGHRALDAYGTGFNDKLSPTEPLDLSRISSISDLVDAYSRCAIGARAVGEAAEILAAMADDRDCFVVCTVSGAMTVAKMGLVLCDMIDHGLVDAVVSTGALMAHGFVEAAGKLHFKYDPTMSDDELFERGYNRVFDSIELERNLDHVEQIFRSVLEDNPDVEVWCSHTMTRALGAHVARHDLGRGILRSAYERNVPVFIPAFSDSELGLDFAIHSHRRMARRQKPLRFDPFLDVDAYKDRVVGAKKLGIFTVGGGVPRNWAQQVGPYLDLLQKRAGIGDGIRRFEYGVRICPEPTHWGGLSGCTYSEGVSWGKFLPVAEGGRYAEVYADATIAWPLVVKAVLERRAARRTPRPVAGRRAGARRGD